ncbi:hypothetical protein, partial [Burkholderia pseudomallei]
MLGETDGFGAVVRRDAPPAARGPTVRGECAQGREGRGGRRPRESAANAGQCGPMRDRRARLPSLATREAPAVRAGGFESRRDAEIAWRSCRRRRLAP